MAPAYVRDCLCCESMPPAEHDPCQCESKGPPVQMQFPEVCAFLMRFFYHAADSAAKA